MALPEVCPLDDSQTCKGRECHLFCLEWRTREPTCLIGYNTTSKVRSNKADRKKDTYAEDTFRKLGQQSQPKWKHVSEKGDWTPSRPVIRPTKRFAERRDENPAPASGTDSQKLFFGCREDPRCARPERSPEESHEERQQKMQAAGEAEKASMRLEARLKKELGEEEPVRDPDMRAKAEERPKYQERPKTQETTVVHEKPKAQETIVVHEKPKVQEKPKAQERVISRDKHATIFAACDGEEMKNTYPSGKEENPRKKLENRDKRKRLDEVMDIDLPDNYEEEFWS